MAGWQSGYAADCNSVYAGSIPTPASISFARMVKLVDTGDLKSPAHCERAGSIPAPGTSRHQAQYIYAELAQLVERNLAKVQVVGSSPIFRSKFLRKSQRKLAFLCLKYAVELRWWCLYKN